MTAMYVRLARPAGGTVIGPGARSESAAGTIRAMATARSTRHFFQFSITSLLLLTGLVAVWLGWELKFIRERQALQRSLRANRADRCSAALGPPESRGSVAFHAPASIPWWREILGDEPITAVTFPPGVAESDLRATRSSFPEAIVEVFPGAPKPRPASLSIPLQVLDAQPGDGPPATP